MVLGEAQILGQLKDAYRVAQEAAAPARAQQAVSGGFFRRQARALGDPIGANAVSLASATVSLARRVYSDLSATPPS
jgi:glutamyl-tRNA reductase